MKLTKSVKSHNPCKSPSMIRADAIQTNYDIVKVDGGELNVESTVRLNRDYCRFLLSCPLSDSPLPGQILTGIIGIKGLYRL